MSEPTRESVRTEVRAFLKQHWDPSLGLVEWRGHLADAGWATPTWPREWFGRGLPEWSTEVIREAFDEVGAVGLPPGAGHSLAAVTILAHGNDDQKRLLLRRIITGEDTWCQLFSEPGSGSDLAGLTTRAELQGDDFVVNGQKVWTTSAHHARYGMLLARTNWDVPKHEGITYFVIEMHQPGVVVHPLRQMNGHASFNQVFFTNARVPKEMVIGQLHKGWTVALTTLAHERRMADGLRSMVRNAKGTGRVFEEYRAEVTSVMEPYKWYPQRAGRVDLVLERARATGRIADPVVRQEIAKLLILARTAEWTARRAKEAQVLGRPPGPEGSLGKLAGSHVARAAADVHARISGADTMLAGADSPMDGLITEVVLSVPAVSIAGGTDEIQRNIISERVLGLPKEPTTDAGKPFRDIPRNVAS
jgi:alkylation response protein AidB-like acyl-CoA dehydrogenase